MSYFDRNRIKDGWEKLHKQIQTDRQTNRHYENNGHLAVNQHTGVHNNKNKWHFCLDLKCVSTEYKNRGLQTEDDCWSWASVVQTRRVKALCRHRHSLLQQRSVSEFLRLVSQPMIRFCQRRRTGHAKLLSGSVLKNLYILNAVRCS